MAEHDRFDSFARRIVKDAGGKTAGEAISSVHDAFVACMPELPENLKHDIAYHFEEVVSGAGEDNPARALAAKLNEALHLLEGEYDRVQETFTTGDWEYIQSVINDFALEMDEQRLTYIMRHIVSRGILDR